MVASGHRGEKRGISAVLGGDGRLADPDVAPIFRSSRKSFGGTNRCGTPLAMGRLALSYPTEPLGASVSSNVEWEIYMRDDTFWGC